MTKAETATGTLTAKSLLHLLLLPWRRYLQFRGRSTRRELWLFVLTELAMLRVLVAIERTLLRASGGAEMDDTHTYWLMASLGIFVLLFVIPTFAVTARRLRDCDQSGLGCLGLLVPYLGLLTIFVLLFVPGTRGPNRFGPDPRGRSGLDPDVAKVFS